MNAKEDLLRVRLLPGQDEFVFSMYSCPGDVEGLKKLVGVMKEKGLGNGFDPGPSARASSRPLFEVLAAVGWPIICYPGYSDMQIREGRCKLSDEDVAALKILDEAGIFNAIQLGEWGYYFHNLSSDESWWKAVYGEEYDQFAHLRMPSGLAGYATKPEGKQECYEVVKDYFRTRNRYMRGRNMSVTGHSHYETYAAEWGAHLIGLEVGENIAFTQSKIAFARGASRQFQKPWSLQMSPWFHGSCTTRGPLVKEGKYARGIDAGHSLSLTVRMWLHGWFAGAALVTPENSLVTFFETKDVGGPLSVYGEKAREVFSFTRKQERGTPYTPIAVVLDEYAGYNGYRGRPWGILEPTQGDQEITDLFQQQLFPGSDHIHRPADPENPESTYLRPTPFGELFDVLRSNASGKVFASYPVLLLVGDIESSRDLLSRLDFALREGSRVLLHPRHIKALTEEALSRLQEAGSVEALEPWTNPDTGRSTAISNERLRELCEEFSPFSVSGDPIQYQINKTHRGWVVELVNNDGVIKFPDRPAETDPSAVATVTLSPRFAVAKATAWSGELHLKQDKAIVRIPPGETAFVEFVKSTAEKVSER